MTGMSVCLEAGTARRLKINHESQNTKHRKVEPAGDARL